MESEMTASLEDYLEAIFVLQQRGLEVRVTDIAAFLGLSKPSVNRAVGNLRDAGYLEHESYGTVTLTPAGEERANRVLTRHKLFKRFLAKTLGVEEATAEEDACRMEHVVSAETIDRLCAYLKQLDEA